MKYIYITGLIIVVALGAYFVMNTGNNTNDSNINAYGDGFSSEQLGVSETSSPTEAPEGGETVVATITTSKGEIVLSLDATYAPQTVTNFVKLAESGFYDGSKFHRVIPGFMIQGGDPLTKDDSEVNRWGTGGPGYTFADEIHARNQNNRGTISMANAGPNTNGSQFFINAADNNFLDAKHTVFGRVESGMEVVTAIENVSTEGPDRPVEAVVIQSIKIQ